jgi:hypothetical protein
MNGGPRDVLWPDDEWEARGRGYPRRGAGRLEINDLGGPYGSAEMWEVRQPNISSDFHLCARLDLRASCSSLRKLRRSGRDS